jgi:hypothetical protein
VSQRTVRAALDARDPVRLRPRAAGVGDDGAARGHSLTVFASPFGRSFLFGLPVVFRKARLNGTTRPNRPFTLGRCLSGQRAGLVVQIYANERMCCHATHEEVRLTRSFAHDSR